MIVEEEEILLNNGIQTIIKAFNDKVKKHQNIINSYEQKIQNLLLENESLKNENSLLKKEINNISIKFNSISNTISKENNIINTNYNPLLTNDLNNNISISTINSLNTKNQIPKIGKNNKNTLFTNFSSPKIINSKSKIDTNESFNIIKNNVDKYKNINQKIFKLRKELSLNLENESFDNSKNENINNYNSIYKNKNKLKYDYENKIKLKNKSSQYQKTSNFLKECKLLLNIKDFENLVQIMKENENKNNIIETKNKVKSLLKNPKLIELFENIYN